MQYHRSLKKFKENKLPHLLAVSGSDDFLKSLVYSWYHTNKPNNHLDEIIYSASNQQLINKLQESRLTKTTPYYLLRVSPEDTPDLNYKWLHVECNHLPKKHWVEWLNLFVLANEADAEYLFRRCGYRIHPIWNYAKQMEALGIEPTKSNVDWLVPQLPSESPVEALLRGDKAQALLTAEAMPLEDQLEALVELSKWMMDLEVIRKNWLDKIQPYKIANWHHLPAERVQILLQLLPKYPKQRIMSNLKMLAFSIPLAESKRVRVMNSVVATWV